MTKKIVCICGMAASGKSTQVDLLGERFGLKVIHTSRLFREMQGLDLKSEGFWEKEGAKFTQKRLGNLSLDYSLDKKLVEIAQDGNVIFDSWTLPWLLKGSCLSIYLKTSQDIRARRVSRRDDLDWQDALQAIRKRDETDTAMYKRLYNYDISTDVLDVFQLIINTDNLHIQDIFKLCCNAIEIYFSKPDNIFKWAEKPIVPELYSKQIQAEQNFLIKP